MATRCSIEIRETQANVIHLYHHYDGYPENIVPMLEKYLSKIHWWLAESIATDLVKNNAGLDDDTFEVAVCAHGDIDYLYEIDCHVHKLRCWKFEYETTYDGRLVKNKKEVYSKRVAYDYANN